jgi:hypothetical protein
LVHVVTTWSESVKHARESRPSLILSRMYFNPQVSPYDATREVVACARESESCPKLYCNWHCLVQLGENTRHFYTISGITRCNLREIVKGRLLFSCGIALRLDEVMAFKLCYMHGSIGLRDHAFRILILEVLGSKLGQHISHSDGLHYSL